MRLARELTRNKLQGQVLLGKKEFVESFKEALAEKKTGERNPKIPKASKQTGS